MDCQSLYTFNQVFPASLIHILSMLIVIVFGQHGRWHGQRQSLTENVSEFEFERLGVLYVFLPSVSAEWLCGARNGILSARWSQSASDIGRCCFMASY